MDGFDLKWLAFVTFALIQCYNVQAQADNQPPVWDDTSLQVMRDGIREDTPIGTSIAQLRCTDPNGDSVGYNRIRGSAVSVSLSGVVRLLIELDFEKSDPIGLDLAFGCYDKNMFDIPLHDDVVTEVELTVDDANDQAPEFNVQSKDGYSFSISEDDNINTKLTPIIFIKDADRSGNSELSYLYILCDSPFPSEKVGLPATSVALCEKFALNYAQVPGQEGEYMANLSMINTLDYETRKVYSSKLVAIDNPKNTSLRLSTTINIQINVQDAQDMDPIFLNPGASTSVSEGASPGDFVNLAVSGRDGDIGDQRPVRFVMLKDEKDAFTFESPVKSLLEEGVYSSRLRVKNALDRESILGAYEFVVKIVELDKKTLQDTLATATATYSVQVTDIDDEPPMFEQSLYSINVTEMEATTQSVQITGLRMVCTDLDESRHAGYTVRIVSQTFPNVFSISPSLTFRGTAILYLTVDKSEYLDYDTPEYRLQTVVVEALSTGTIPLSSSTTVSITLNDLNDHRPEFLDTTFSLSISESISLDELPYTFPRPIKARDDDSGINGQITYRLEGGTSDKFEIDSTTGELSLVSLIDYETTPSYVFLVFAVDGAAQDKQTGQVQVTVTIQNANDIAPKFQQESYQTSVNEDKLQFLTPINVFARDTEEGTGTITYSIVKGQTADNSFNLNSFTGSLTLSKLLDYGTNGIYDLVIEATDNGSPPLTDQVPVRVSVIDQNNFPPVLNPDRYSKTLSEIVSPGTVVATIIGKDLDEGEFGKITYRIVEGGFDNFLVDPEKGVVTINDPQNFDADLQKSYSVRIIATDGGAPQRSAFATVKVDITDANNKAPKFKKTIYISNVDEKEDIGFVITSVFAVDPDTTKKLVYSMQSVQARNGNGSPLDSIATYNYKEALGINNATGDVYVKNQLDKEQALEISFIAQVRDENAQTPGQTDTTRVAITIRGEANTDLSFEAITQSFLNEGSEVGYEVTTVRARDPTTQDPIQNYQLVELSEFFAVDTIRGQVKLKKRIDYETDPIIHRVVIRAVAKDNLRSATVTLTIKINDDNDNSPVFEKPLYTTTVDEDAPALTTVANIAASDVDTASYGPIEYKIGGGLDSDHFKLYKTAKGVDVYVASSNVLDYNNRDEYELDIVALDNPKRRFSNVQQVSTVKLKITVIDKNNHKPEFLEEVSVRKMAVAETASNGKSVGTIVATDDDFGANGEVTYDLLPVDGDPESLRGTQLFRVVPRAGIITVASSLLGYGGNVYNVIVFARDGGEPFQSNTLRLTIEVLSTENTDGNPVWHSPLNNHIYFAEEEHANYVITERGSSLLFDVSPRTGNGILFFLSDKSDSKDSFHINSTTGVITVLESLDREVKATYNLLVYAADTTNTSLIRTGRQIIIQLSDKDDNSPSFMNPKNYPQCPQQIERPLDIFVYENVDDRVISTLRACDPDLNNPIYYYAYDANDYCGEMNRESKFYIHEDGRISKMKDAVIDYEEKSSYPMCAVATSQRRDANARRKRDVFDVSQVNLNLDNVAYIMIHVRDVNDNGPKFPKPEATAVMITDARDYPIIVMDAVDADGKGFNIPIYTILKTEFYASGSRTPIYPGRAFVMENNELHPDPPRGFTFLDFARGRFVLTIQAQDPVNPDLTDIQIVTVYVYIRGQAVKVILDMLPSQGSAIGDSLVAELNKLSSSYAFEYLHVSVHKNKDGIDVRKTDVCFIAVDKSTHNILTIFELVNLLAKTEYRDLLEDDSFKANDRGKCYPSTSSESQVKWRDLWWVLVIVAIFIAICSLFFIVIIFFMHRRYRRYMETEKTYFVPQ